MTLKERPREKFYEEVKPRPLEVSQYIVSKVIIDATSPKKKVTVRKLS